MTVWAVRLGTFLYRRVHADGGDGRFDDLKVSVPKFLIVWTIQAAWVSMTALAMLLVNTGPAVLQRPWLLVLGALVWVTGFAIEVVADHHAASAPALRDAIVADLMRHIGQGAVLDDITLVVAKVLPDAAQDASVRSHDQ